MGERAVAALDRAARIDPVVRQRNHQMPCRDPHQFAEGQPFDVLEVDDAVRLLGNVDPLIARRPDHSAQVRLVASHIQNARPKNGGEAPRDEAVAIIARVEIEVIDRHSDSFQPLSWSVLPDALRHSSSSLAFFMNELKQPIPMWINPGTPSRNPRRTK